MAGAVATGSIGTLVGSMVGAAVGGGAVGACVGAGVGITNAGVSTMVSEGGVAEAGAGPVWMPQAVIATKSSRTANPVGIRFAVKGWQTRSRGGNPYFLTISKLYLPFRNAT